MKKSIIIAVLIILISSSLIGCSPVTKLEQSATMGTRYLDNQGSIGQTFVAHYDGLSGISIYLERVGTGNGKLNLKIFASPTESDILSAGSLDLKTITQPDFYPIKFQPIPDSRQAYYYLVLEVEGSGKVNIGTAPGYTYNHGALYQDNLPQDEQMAFNLVYNTISLIVGLVLELFTWIAYLGVGVFLWVLPGWAVLSRLLPSWPNHDWVSKTALASGVSLSIYPVLILWTDVIGLHLGALYAWFPPLVGAADILWSNKEKIKGFSLKQIRPRKPTWKEIALVITLALIFAVRFWVTRSLEGPIGNDSVHHTIISQLLIDNKGLMKSWLPYVESSTFSYHFGFHSLVSGFSWITTKSIPQSILIVGQLMNFFAILVLYPVSNRISRNHWSGTLTLLLAGILFPMPMYYINWGRYTQLSSQIILLVAILVLWEFFDTQERNRRYLPLSWLLLSGLGLSHYRIFIFALCFFPTYWIFNYRRIKFRGLIFKSIGIMVGFLFVFLPWLLEIIQGKLAKTAIDILTTPASNIHQTIKSLNQVDIFFYLPGWAWLALPIGIGWGIWKHNRQAIVFSTWWALILIAANPSWLNLPGDGLISHGTVITGSFIPVAVLVAHPLGDFFGIIKFHKTRLLFPITFFLLFGALLLGLRRQKNIIEPWAIHITRPDIRAFEWINENTDSDAVFLVNSASILNTNWWYIGIDAGWWMPVYSKRPTTAQNMIYSIEGEVYPEKREKYIQITQEINQKGVIDAPIMDQMLELGISYIYIGQTNNNLLLGVQSSELETNPNLRKVYHQDRVWIFKVSK